MSDESLQDAMDRLTEAMARGREALDRHQAKRKAEILARMEVGEPVDVGQAVWATDGECLRS